VWRVGFGASLALAMSMAPFVHYAVSVLAPFIIADLGLSRTQIGVLTSVVFVLAALSGPILGRLVDAVGGRTVIGLLFACGVGALLGLGSARDYAWVVAACLLSGVAMGAANPATNNLIGAALRPGERGFLMGVKQSGVKLGQLVAASTMPATAAALGWRASLFVSGGAAALLGAVATVSLPQHRRRHDAGERRSGTAPVPAFVPRVVLFGFLMGLPQAAVSTYVPLYAFERLELTPTLAGAVAGLVGAIGMISRVVWGRAAERLQSVSVPLTFIAVGTAASMVMILAAEPGPVALIWGGAVLFGATAPVWNVVAMLAVITAAGPGATGRASGLVMAGFSGGFIVGPVAFGLSVDVTGTYTIGWVAAAVCAVAAAIVARTSRSLRAPSVPAGQ
jgi:predicted MFS family arabinose efflux permease